MEASGARLLDGTRLVTDEALQAIREHALRAFPYEALGYVQPDGSYAILANLSPRPASSAYPDKREFADIISSGRLRALVHSHPGGPDCPSENDMSTQMELEVPFILLSTNGQATTVPFAWGDQLADDRDLIGRPFRHGVDDCYALVRNYFKREGVTLPDYPRNWEWWLEQTPGDKNLYERFFVEAGFHTIAPSEVVVGDCWIATVRSDVPNHAGVVVADGLALHHPSAGLAYDMNRLSKRDPLARWFPYVTHWVRRGE